ncbi:MAG: hypothetical protein L3J44_04500, partial [Campylobacteraceae bacterium]|nr:hypothetical protein [Campylobacteraceae bacterium]
MNILANDILNSTNVDKAKILNSIQKQVSKTLGTLKNGNPISSNISQKNISLDVLLNSLFEDLGNNVKTKDAVLQILQDKKLFLDVKETIADLKSIVSDLKATKLPLKNTPVLQKLLLDIKDISAKTIQKQISQSGLFLESNLLKIDTPKTLISVSIQETLASLKTLILEKNLNIDTTIIEKLLSHKTADKSFINTIKELVQNSQISKNQQIVDVVAKLDNLIQTNQLLESKISNDMPISASSIKINIEEILTNLTKIDILKPQMKEIVSQLNLAINQTSKITNINKTQFLNLNLNEKLQRAVNLIKSELTQIFPKMNSLVEVTKLVQTLQKKVHESIASKQIVSSQPLLVTENAKEVIAKDIKANLLYIKDEISKSKSISLPEITTKIDKVLT